ncbi:uncharacterized protein LOC117327152 [Pecten maximus]|uniref:uncharacterized protein LOC117327152 n=1 Tax=Pecten maximus TaxID=6579 RepID=UPI001458519A|nr:uncharacterized protein LOC117327152 [Pecten maximus]
MTCFKPDTPMTSPPPSPAPPISKIATTTTKFTTGVKRSTDTEETTMSIQTSQANTPESSCYFDEKEYVYLPVYALAIIIVSMCLVSLYAVVVTFLYLRRYLNSEKRPNNNPRSAIPDEGGYENMPIPSNTEGTYEGLELSQVNFTPNTYDDLGNSGT